MRTMWREWVVRMLVATGMAIPSPVFVFAQEYSVEPAEFARASELVADLVSHTDDPVLAGLIKDGLTECQTDVTADGVLDSPELTEAVEAVEVVEQAEQQALVQVAKTELVSTVASVNPELARQIENLALGAPGGGLVEGSRAEARTIFNEAYQEALRTDPEGAQRMKEMFDGFEKGEFDFVKPTPEMVEKMQAEMEKYCAQSGNDVARDYVDHYGGVEAAERLFAGEYGGYERMTMEGLQGGPHEMDRAAMEQAMREHGFAPERYAEFEKTMAEHVREAEHYREMLERDTSTILDQHAETSGGVTGHTKISESGGMENWDGNGDGTADHTHSIGTAAH